MNRNNNYLGCPPNLDRLEREIRAAGVHASRKERVERFGSRSLTMKTDVTNHDIVRFRSPANDKLAVSMGIKLCLSSGRICYFGYLKKFLKECYPS